MSDGGREAVRVIVQIKRVWLAVRFSCKLGFIVRNELGEKIAETDSTFSLTRGECLVNETLHFELPPEVIAARARKLKLVVVMVSANGMVPAGFVTFPTHPRSPYEQFEAILPLERCEDARAQIKFMHMYELTTRTPIAASYLSHLNTNTPAAILHTPKPASLNKDAFSPRRHRHRDTESHVKPASLTKPLISPRLLSRNSEAAIGEQAGKVSSFRREGEIVQEKEPNDSSINPLTKEQLVKEHQEYWLEIVRMEEEMETARQDQAKLREEAARAREEAERVGGENAALKEYYEGHEEKIHALVGEVEENAEIIRRLETEAQEYRTVIAQKDELEREFQKVMEAQSTEFRHNLNKIADLEERLRGHEEDRKNAALKCEMLEETVAFLQAEAKKYAEQNYALNDKLTAEQERAYFLLNTTEAQKNIIAQLEAKVAQLVNDNDVLAPLQQANASLSAENEMLRAQVTESQFHLEDLQKELLAHSESKEMLQLQSSLKAEEAAFAHEKQGELSQRLEELTRTYEATSNAAAVDHSKLQILQKELEAAGKEQERLVVELRRKEQEAKDAKAEAWQLNETGKALTIKLIEHEASLAGKIATIDQLKASLAETTSDKEELAERHLSIEREFEEMSLLLTKEVEDKNKLTILLTTLEENYRALHEDKATLARERQELTNELTRLKAYLGEQQQGHQQEQEHLKREQERLQQELGSSQEQLRVSQEQLAELTEKTGAIELQLEATLGKLDEQNAARNTYRDQYQDSYNQSMTALTLKNAKIERELEELKAALLREKTDSKQLAARIAAKENELNEVKGFTHTKLQENLKMMKESGELKGALARAEEESRRLASANEQLARANRESAEKMEQLSNELQFVTEVLQRERQEKSDIEKEIDHLEKGELPQIEEVGHLKEDSVDEYRPDSEPSLQIESKLASNDAPAKKKKKKQ